MTSKATSVKGNIEKLSLNRYGHKNHNLIQRDKFFSIPEKRSSVSELQCDNIQSLRSKFEKSCITLSVDNWQRTLSTLLAYIEKRDYSLQECSLIRGWIARLLECAYKISYKNGKGAEVFEQQLEGIRAEIVKHFTSIQNDEEVINGKRLPPLTESLDATLERYAVIEKLSAAFGQHVESIILSGSMSYGPFFNVRKYSGRHSEEEWNSDIDLLAVFNESFVEQKGWETLLGSELFYECDARSFIKRKSIFTDLFNSGAASVFAHRFDIVNHDFNLSIHFLLPRTFNEIFDEQLEVDLEHDDNIARTMRIYKPSRFRRTVCIENAFDGSKYNYIVPDQIHVEGGIITTLNNYTIVNRKFFPGLLQSMMMLPDHEIIKDSSVKNTLVINKHHELLLKRVSREKSDGSNVSLINAHARHMGFAPERYK